MKRLQNTTFTVDDIRKAVRPLLKKYDAEGAVLFGSYADGTATDESDIDILLISAAPIKPFKIFAFAAELKKRTGKQVDAYGQHELVDGGMLQAEISQHGVALC